MKWFIKCFKHYADFSGRARRKEYWMFVLVNIIFAVVFGVILGLVELLHPATSSVLPHFFGISDEQIEQIILFIIKYDKFSVMVRIICTIVCLIYLAILILPSIAVAVRRLHDIGKSGWMLLVSLIPIVGEIWLLVLMLTNSQTEENQYGPSPKTTND